MRFPTLCALYVIFVLGGCSQTLSQISNEHGFQRLQAPQKVLEPGTLITYEESGESSTAITPVCWRHQAFPGMPPARSVPDAEQDLRGQFGDWHNLDPAYLGKIQAKFPKVEDIQLRLGNASVSEYSDTKLYKGLPTRSQSCRDAIAAREGNGETVYTILKVLNADVTYRIIGVDRVRHVKGKLPQKTLERLKIELGGSSVSTYEQTIKGANLQVAFQADIIGIAARSTSPAETESLPTMEAESMASTETKSVPSLESETTPNKEAESMASTETKSVPSLESETTPTIEANSPPYTEKAAISETESGEIPRVSRITEAQRQSMIKKMAVLSRGTSDADRYQK